MIKQIYERPTPKFSKDEDEGRILFIVDIFLLV